MKVLIIIPAYNEEGNIERVVDNLKKVCPEYDHLIIDDASSDNTKAICIQQGYNYLSLPVNLGIGGGVQTGYRYANENGYDIAVQFDGDGQHEAGCIKDIIAPIISRAADSVIGSRFIEKKGFQSSSVRRFGISFLSGIIKILTGVRVLDVTSGFRAINRAQIIFFSKNYAQDYPEPEAILSSALSGFRITEVPVIMHERQTGKSSINPVRSVYYMIKVSIALFIGRLTYKGGKR